jgi:hypothetical protein
MPGNRRHARRLLEGYLNEYLKGGARHRRGEKASPLFRTLGGRARKQLTAERMTREDARRMIVRRAFKDRDHHPARLPYLPGNCDHGVSAQWRTARIRRSDGSA